MVENPTSNIDIGDELVKEATKKFLSTGADVVLGGFMATAGLIIGAPIMGATGVLIGVPFIQKGAKDLHDGLEILRTRKELLENQETLNP